MKNPTISVVSVVRNDEKGLKKTINSIISQDYIDFEYIVIDGGSTDGTNNIIQENKRVINKLISEPDAGIYHAMNKAISIADGKWLIFMNAGDCFYNPKTLSSVAKALSDDVDVIFADWLYRSSGVRVKANFNKLNVRHQSIIYKKELHKIYGNYLVGNHVSISDYLFFLSIKHLNWKYFEGPISICEQYGISAQPSHFYQRILSECLFGFRSKFTTCAILLCYPVYRLVKRSVLRKI